MSRGLGIVERAIAAAIAECQRRDGEADEFCRLAGRELPPRPVMVRPRDVWLQIEPDVWKEATIRHPSKAQTKAITRAMHSFVRKFPQFALISGTGRGHLCLYERGDPLSAMWATLNAASAGLITLDIAQTALKHLQAGRNEPFVTGRKKDCSTQDMTRYRGRTFRDISLPRE